MLYDSNTARSSLPTSLSSTSHLSSSTENILDEIKHQDDESARKEKLLRSSLTVILSRRGINEQPFDSKAITSIDNEQQSQLELFNSSYNLPIGGTSSLSPNAGRPLPPRPRTASLDRRTRERETARSSSRSDRFAYSNLIWLFLVSDSSRSRTSFDSKADYLSSAYNTRSNATDRDVIFHSSREEDRVSSFSH